MEVAIALDVLVPGAEYRGSLTANTESAYDALVWEDERTQPTWAEIVAADATLPGDFPPLTPRQLRLMMLQVDLVEADVETEIAAISDAEERAAAMIEWKWATHYERGHPLVALLAAALEFEPHEIDALWGYAAEL